MVERMMKFGEKKNSSLT